MLTKILIHLYWCLSSYHWIGMKVHCLDYSEKGYVNHSGKNFSTEDKFHKA